MATLTNKSAVQLLLCSNVKLVRLCRIVASAKADCFAVDHDACLPAIPVSLYAKKSAFTSGFGSVVAVDESRDIAQIAYSVVCAVAVYVVNLVFGPFARGVQPCKSMLKVLSSGNPNGAISSRAKSSASATAYWSAVWGLDKPRKSAGLGIVVNKFAQTLRGKIGLSHDALLLLIGQRPACVGSTCGLRYFNAKVAA